MGGRTQVPPVGRYTVTDHLACGPPLRLAGHANEATDRRTARRSAGEVRRHVHFRGHSVETELVALDVLRHECQEFLACTADDRLADLYRLMTVTGMRRGETVGLRWEDVDLDDEFLFVIQQITEVNGRSVVSTPKTKKGQRLVQIDRDTSTMLRRHREAQKLERSAWGPAWNDACLVFTREDGRALRPDYVTRHFRELAETAGLPPIRLHDLRHTSASLALAAGVDLKVVSERLGHSQLAITADLYTHVNRHLGKAAAQQIADVLWPRSVTVPSAFLAHGPETREPTGGEEHD